MNRGRKNDSENNKNSGGYLKKTFFTPYVQNFTFLHHCAQVQSILFHMKNINYSKNFSLNIINYKASL